MAKRIAKLRKRDNLSLMNAVRSRTSAEYMSQVPVANERTASQVHQLLMRYRPLRNEFASALVNKVGESILTSRVWTHDFREFSGGMLETGESIEEAFVGVAERYDSAVGIDIGEGYIFGRAVPDIHAAYHRITRTDSFKTTVDEVRLRRALMEGPRSESLADWLDGLHNSLILSDNLAEYAAVTATLRRAWRRGDFARVETKALTSEANTKVFLQSLRATAGKLQFPSGRWNPEGVPSFARMDDLVTILTPDALAAIDVQGLAAAFNIDSARAPGRFIMVDEGALPNGVVAMMVPTGFLVMRDTDLQQTEAVNPAGRYTNLFLHHDQIIGCSPFVPRAVFATADPPQSTPEISGLEVFDDGGTRSDIQASGKFNARRGAYYEVNGPEAAHYRILGPDGCRSTVTADGIFYASPNDAAGLVITIQVSAWEGGQPQTRDLLFTLQ